MTSNLFVSGMSAKSITFLFKSCSMQWSSPARTFRTDLMPLCEIFPMTLVDCKSYKQLSMIGGVSRIWVYLLIFCHWWWTLWPMSLCFVQRCCSTPCKNCWFERQKASCAVRKTRICWCQVTLPLITAQCWMLSLAPMTVWRPPASLMATCDWSVCSIWFLQTAWLTSGREGYQDSEMFRGCVLQCPARSGKRPSGLHKCREKHPTSFTWWKRSEKWGRSVG